MYIRSAGVDKAHEDMLDEKRRFESSMLFASQVELMEYGAAVLIQSWIREELAVRRRKRERQRAILASVRLLQPVVRGYLAKCHYKNMRASYIKASQILQRNWRGKASRLSWQRAIRRAKLEERAKLRKMKLMFLNKQVNTKLGEIRERTECRSFSNASALSHACL